MLQKKKRALPVLMIKKESYMETFLLNENCSIRNTNYREAIDHLFFLDKEYKWNHMWIY
jgi:hypothetical protein